MRAVRCISRRMLVSLLLAPLVPASVAAAPTASEVKAVYLYNFASFVDWPDTAFGGAATFEICVLRDDSLSRALEGVVAGESVGGRRLVARRIARALEAAGCQIVFIGGNETVGASGVLQAVAGKPVLTVGEVEVFAREGGMIRFVMERGTVRFQINAAAVSRSGLVMSSKLLQLARVAVADD